MRVSVLGSGSQGNATYVEAGGTRVLVDAGFSGRDLARRLERLGVDALSIDAVVITHDHGDHTRGMGVFARRFGVPLHMTERTEAACVHLLKGDVEVRHYRPGRPFAIGSVRVDPFLTVHDAVDPVGVTLSDVDTGSRLGIATDLGRPTAHVRHALSRCHFLVLEANHDEVLLRTGPYPWSVKSRIASSHGHLSNQAAARFALDLLHPRLAGVLLAHLSTECNRPELAEKVVSSSLAKAGFRGFLGVARQNEPTELLDVELLLDRVGPAQYSFF